MKKYIDSLTTFPKRTQVRMVISGKELRFLKASKYTVAYCVEGNMTVKIYGVFHSHRDIFKIIEGRKLSDLS